MESRRYPPRCHPHEWATVATSAVGHPSARKMASSGLVKADLMLSAALWVSFWPQTGSLWSLRTPLMWVRSKGP